MPGCSERGIAVLYAKKGSVYHSIPGLDVWDEARDARLYRARGQAVIAHPPCRAWGRFAQWAKPAEHECDLAFHALACVRDGGVLEHPRASKLWKAGHMPRPGEPPDKFGGWTLEVNQVDWGHRAIKPTWLYIVGVSPDELPARPVAGIPETTVERMWRGEREATPLRFALWLVQIANRV